MLTVDELHFSYGAVQALRGVNLFCEPGKVSCIIGRNGVGKTTLLETIMGLRQADSGSVRLGDQQMVGMPAYARAKAGIGLVPQGRQIFPKLTVEENLQLGLQGRTDGVKTIPKEIFTTFPILKDFAQRKGGDLSGGQQQQLAIGRALAGDPQVLLLDEPTEGIQPNVIQEIGRVLRRLADDRNMTIILVEQYLDFVKEIGDTFSIMNRGEVVASGLTCDLTEELVDEHLTV